MKLTKSSLVLLLGLQLAIQPVEAQQDRINFRNTEVEWVDPSEVLQTLQQRGCVLGMGRIQAFTVGNKVPLMIDNWTGDVYLPNRVGKNATVYKCPEIRKCGPNTRIVQTTPAKVVHKLECSHEFFLMTDGSGWARSDTNCRRLEVVQ